MTVTSFRRFRLVVRLLAVPSLIALAALLWGILTADFSVSWGPWTLLGLGVVWFSLSGASHAINERLEYFPEKPGSSLCVGIVTNRIWQVSWLFLFAMESLLHGPLSAKLISLLGTYTPIFGAGGTGGSLPVFIAWFLALTLVPLAAGWLVYYVTRARLEKSMRPAYERRLMNEALTDFYESAQQACGKEKARQLLEKVSARCLTTEEVEGLNTALLDLGLVIPEVFGEVSSNNGKPPLKE